MPGRCRLTGACADPYALVAELLSALPSGSYLAMSNMTADVESETTRKLAEAPGHEAQYVFVMRSKEQVARFFDGLELVGPGVSLLEEWLPREHKPAHPASARMHWCAIARKP